MTAITLLLALAAGLGLDWAAGDPPNKYHPVAWLGRLISFFVPRLKAKTALLERIKGAVFAVALVALVGMAAHLAAAAALQLAGAFALGVFSAVALKVAVAVRGMERHAEAIMACLERGDVPGARQSLSMIVRRDTGGLGEQHILSATIECVSESTVDGIAGPVFYYSLLGPAGALAYRAINTLDSMVGYKDGYYRHIGWMSARLDTAANYVPARLTAVLMVVSARMLGADWKNSLQMLQRDHAKTFSPNAGYPMAAVAGALRIRLEKIGHYALGDGREPATIEKCRASIAIMKLTTLLLFAAFSVPVMAVLYLAGWWRLLLGIP
jgi:adenosylcobinamide-phosphate synthase